MERENFLDLIDLIGTDEIVETKMERTHLLPILPGYSLPTDLCIRAFYEPQLAEQLAKVRFELISVKCNF